MLPPDERQPCYQALLDRDGAFEGRFFVGVTTTGIFCRPTCPARKPKFEHCEFYRTAQEALLAAFRPCLRCRPLSHPSQVSPVVAALVEAVEAEPERRWRDADFEALSIDAATARRQFQKRFGMTFVAYARARRMGLALKQIRAGEAVIEAQLSSGYTSGSGFRDAFTRILGAPPSVAKPRRGGPSRLPVVPLPLFAAWLDTPLGPMLTIADDEGLHLLEFVDRRGLEREVERLRQRLGRPVIPGRTPITEALAEELAAYFAGALQTFRTPLVLAGSPFQRAVWEELLRIPVGETRTYGALAAAVGRPTAVRAVAQANGANVLALVVPCHRVIETGGGLGGYGGGLSRKDWLLDHERALAGRLGPIPEESPGDL